ncbi:MAG: response regulator [Lachnospiraceae bacterium]|nr:response regulator [Lachnospiraceae bacterium]
MANVLIVDDSRTSRRILRGIIEGMGHTVCGEAVNGEEGVRLYEELRPELVTMDITMPVMDGLTSMQKIHEIDRAAKVVMVTAVGQRNKVVECIKEGASDYVTKPYEVSDVEKVIEKVLSKE